MDTDSFTKAEMYFNLATIELNNNGKIDQVIALSNS
jgi:hypothetical protein